MPWRPGERARSRALEAPYEDVPAHLVSPLWEWIDERLDVPVALYVLGLDLRIDIPDPRPGGMNMHNAKRDLQRRVLNDPALMLDVVEWLLSLERTTSIHARSLEVILSRGHSAYRVADHEHGLETRVLAEVKAQVQAVVDEAVGSPGEHLATAWAEAYGRTPDPVKAYSEAIKAVEAAAAPVISPTNARATLGTIIRDIKAAPTKWTFAIASPNGNSVEDVQRLLSLLWEGQTSRHGGVHPTVPETPKAARAAVHIAATLVQFFVGKSFT